MPPTLVAPSQPTAPVNPAMEPPTIDGSGIVRSRYPILAIPSCAFGPVGDTHPAVKLPYCAFTLDWASNIIGCTRVARVNSLPRPRPLHERDRYTGCSPLPKETGKWVFAETWVA